MIGDVGAIALSEFLMINTTLIGLILFDCGIGPEGGKAIAAALVAGAGAGLKKLEMRGNDLDDDAKAALRNAARQSQIQGLQLRV